MPSLESARYADVFSEQTQPHIARLPAGVERRGNASSLWPRFCGGVAPGQESVDALHSPVAALARVMVRRFYLVTE